MEAVGYSRKGTLSERYEGAWRIDAPIIAMADGNPDSWGAAGKALMYLSRLLRHTALSDLQNFTTWEAILTAVDTYFTGAPRCSLIAGALIGGGIYGASIGDICCYRVNEQHYLDRLADGGRSRVGDGHAVVRPLHGEVGPSDLIIMTTAPEHLDRLTVRKARTENPFEMLPRVLITSACSQGICPQDITIITARR